MNSYIDTIKVTDKNGNKSILYPNTKKEAVYGLVEDLENLSVPDITATMDVVMPNSHDGRFLFKKIKGVCEQFMTTGKNICGEILLGKVIDCATGKVGDNDSYACTDYVPVEYGKTYTISNCTTTDENWFYDVDKAPLSKIPRGTPRVVTISDSNIKYVRCTMTIGNVNAFMIEEGSVATDYEPYTGGQPAPNPSYPQEIKKSVVSEVKTHGKNVLKHIVSSRTTSGLDVKASKEVISVSGTNSSAITISVCDTTIKNTKGLFVKAPKVRSGINYMARVHRGDSISYLHVLENGLYIPAGGDIGRLYLQQNTVNTTIDLELEPQIVEGFEDSIFEPYTESIIKLSEPIELYGIGDVQDTIECGKVKRRYGKVVFDGSADEYWYSENNYFILQGVNTDNTVPILCPHLRQTKIYEEINSNSKGGTIWVNVNGFTINMTGVCSTVAELRSWLAENQLTVIYGLPTPTEEELPLADQIALNSIATYDGITHLEFDSEIEPTFEGEYGTSKAGGYALEGMLAGRNGELYGKRVEALEATVVNNI